MKKTALVIVLLIGSSFRFTDLNLNIYMVGDSTMASKNIYDAPETGWGQVFSDLFTENVNIYNHAKNGRSSKSFRNEGLWDNICKNLKPGDYVIIQFGHNDQKNNDTSRFAAPQTDYKENLRRYVAETVSKGAFPILCTPVNRRKFEGGQFIDQHGDYPDVVRKLASELRVPMIDMHHKSLDIIKTMGEEDSKDLFLNIKKGYYPKFPNGVTDNTHFTAFGAKIMAKAAAECLIEMGSPLRNFLKKSVHDSKYAFELPIVNVPTFKKDTFNIIKYGAKPDGFFNCAAAINLTIKMASENGGGVVLVPKGMWLSGPIELRNDVNLHLSDGSFVQFSDNRNDYPVIETTWEGQASYRCQAPISGKNLKNIAITGKGIFDGAGQVWKQVKKSKLTESQWKNLISSGGVVNEKKDAWYPSESSKYGNENTEWTNKIVKGKTKEDYEKIRDFLRPNMVSLTSCTNILIESVTFLNSPAWTLHPLMCKHISLLNVNVKNPWFGQNNDALDLESCNTGMVDGCTFDTGDDAITIKSGKNEQGRERGIPTANFIIKNTTVFHGHGGFVIGSEMSGGVNNMFVSNCNFLGTDIGLRFKTTRGRGGVVENIFISGINMNNIPGDAIKFDMYYEAIDPVPMAGEKRSAPILEIKPFDAGTPVFRKFYIENVSCSGAENAVVLKGIPESKISEITIKNVNIISKNGISITEAMDINLINVNIKTQKKDRLLEIINSQNIGLKQIGYREDLETFAEISGEETKQIQVTETTSKNLKNKFILNEKVKKSTVNWK